MLPVWPAGARRQADGLGADDVIAGGSSARRLRTDLAVACMRLSTLSRASARLRADDGCDGSGPGKDRVTQGAASAPT